MIGILGLIFVIVAPIFIYRSARQTGCSAVVWALAALAVGVGVQVAIPTLIVIVVVAVMLASGSPPVEADRQMLVVANISGLICLVLSVLGTLLMMRRVAKIPEEKSFAAPPSPPEF